MKKVTDTPATATVHEAEAPPPSQQAGHALPKIDIDDLRCFLAAIYHRNFRRAAESLDMVQSNLSRRMSALEDKLGNELFDRGPPATLTRVGEVLRPHAERALQAIYDGERDVAALTVADDGLFKVGFLPSHLGLAAPALTTVLERYPGLRIRVDDEARTARIVERVLNGSVEVGLAFETVPHPDLTSTSIGGRGFGVVVSDQHELAQRSDVELNELKSMRFALLSTTTRTRSRLDHYFKANDFAPDVVLEAKDVATVLSIVRRGAAITILPTLRDRQGLAILKLTPEPDEQPTVLVRRTATPISKAAALFMAEVTKRAPEWLGR